MDKFEEKIKGMEFIGIVEDNVDPDKKQRIKVRIPYFHGSKEEIPTDAIPWAQPMRDNAGLSFSIPDINKIINVTFPSGNLYYPVYNNAQHLNINLQKKIEQYDGKDVTKFVSFCYNYNTQLFVDAENLNLVHNKSGMIVDYYGNVVTRLNGNNSIYKVGDDNASQAMLLANNWFQWFDSFIKALPTAYIGNLGVTALTDPNFASILAQYPGMKKTFMSENAFISDNGAISNNDTGTELSVGDNFNTAMEEGDLALQYEEIKKAEIKEVQKDEAKKEEAKEILKDEKIDEQINESDGLLNDEVEVSKVVQELSTINTYDIEVTEEQSAEPSVDKYEDENDLFGIEPQISDDEVGSIPDIFENDVNDENFDYTKAPNGSVALGAVGSYGSVNSSAGSSGRKSNAMKIDEKIETLDMSLLPAPGMISKFLSYKAVLRSSNAKRIGDPNTPDNNQHLRNLIQVTAYYFDGPFKFFKEKYGLILVLNSAYRNKRVNDATKGSSSTSQHKSGSALDLCLKDKEGNNYNNLLFYYMKYKMKNFGQLVWEGNIGDGPNWVHISLNNRGVTGSIFTAVGGVFKQPNEFTLKVLKENNIYSEPNA